LATLNIDLEAQRAAMAKLAFLVGKWEGEARIYRGPGEPTVLRMTEDASYRLGGLILLIEGIGRSKADGKAALQAIGFVSYGDAKGTYHMRAFNDGRFLESPVKLLEDGKSLAWGFTLDQIRTSSVLRINERGEWTEQHEITIGEQPAKKFMEMVVRRTG